MPKIKQSPKNRTDNAPNPKPHKWYQKRKWRVSKRQSYPIQKQKSRKKSKIKSNPYRAKQITSHAYKPKNAKQGAIKHISPHARILAKSPQALYDKHKHI